MSATGAAKIFDVTMDESQKNGIFDGSLHRCGCSNFCNVKIAENLLKTDTIIREGAIMTAPRPFDQIYTFFLRFWRAKNSSVCWALLKRQQQSQYEFILRKLQKKKF